jgi:hypothetical protein
MHGDNARATDYGDPMCARLLGTAADVLRSFGSAFGGRHLAIVGGAVPSLLVGGAPKGMVGDTCGSTSRIPTSPMLAAPTPPALRLYDGLSLLSPARVNELSGYRSYEGAQLRVLRRDTAEPFEGRDRGQLARGVRVTGQPEIQD